LDLLGETAEATLKAIHRLIKDSETHEDQSRLLKREMALFIAEATGRRRGAIIGLRWDDFDFVKGTIKWRAAHDKVGRDGVIPMPANFMDGIRRFRSKLWAVAGPLFPGV
jgi:integrase